MTEPADLRSYPTAYLDLVEAVGSQGLTVRQTFKDNKEAMRARKRIYGFLRALRADDSNPQLAADSFGLHMRVDAHVLIIYPDDPYAKQIEKAVGDARRLAAQEGS